MSVAEIKSDIHKMVVQTDDVVLLRQIQQYLKTLIDDSYDWFEDLNDTDKAKINQGLDDLDNSNSISDAQMRSKFITKSQTLMPCRLI